MSWKRVMDDAGVFFFLSFCFYYLDVGSNICSEYNKVKLDTVLHDMLARYAE